jgi:hypothetical protein
MRKLLYLSGLLAVTALVATGAALAGDDNGVIGTPGQPTCIGQTTSALSDTGDDLGSPGLAGYAELAGLTVQQVTANISDYCTNAFLGTPPPPQRRDSEVNPNEPSGSGGGGTLSCDDAKTVAGTFNTMAAIEEQAANALPPGGGEWAGHIINAQAFHDYANAIVEASCPSTIQ